MSDLILENNCLKISMSSDTATFDVFEKVTGSSWSHDPFTNSAGEVVLQNLQDQSIHEFDLSLSGGIQLHQDGNCVQVSFTSLRSLDGISIADSGLKTAIVLVADKPEIHVQVLEIQIDDTKWNLVSIMYPARQFSLRTFVDEGWLVLPYGQGCLVPSGRFKKPPRNDHHQYDDLSWAHRGMAWGSASAAYGDIPYTGWNALTMPWFGAIKENSSFICIFETEDDAAVNCILNYNMQDTIFSKLGQFSTFPRIAAVSPRWRSQMGKLGYPRNAVYHFIAHGTYSDLAKKFRQFVMESGKFRSLRDKARENPNIRRLYGAPILNIDGGYPWYTDYESFRFTWKDVERIAVDMKENLGIEKAFIHTWGGYTKLPPENLPFSAQMGTVGELQQAVKTIQDMGYLYASYHGYPALLSHSTAARVDESVQTSDNTRMGGRWGGRCSRFHAKYAHSLAEACQITGQLADYSDMVTSSGLRECHNLAHPHTRSEEKELINNLYQYIHSLGLIGGSEVAASWVTPLMDYCKAGMYVGKQYFLLNYIHVPLFNLVYHDSMVLYDGTVGVSRIYEYAPEVLECIAYGINLVFSCSLPYYNGLRRIMQEETACSTEFLNEVGEQELKSHQYLDDGYNVQRTEFESGAQVTINTDTADFEWDGLTVPARGYVIRNSQGQIRTKGSIKTEMTCQAMN